MQLYLGIDGGGSKTTCAVCDASGRVLGIHVGESINYYALGMEKARENMQTSILTLQRKCITPVFRSVFIGMSALNTRATPRELAAFTRNSMEADIVDMDSDLFIALQAGGIPGELCVVIAGTGSMVAARTQQGDILTAGGWGHTLGDEGSGYWLALEGIKAAIRGQENKNVKTQLTQAVLSHYNITDMSALIDLFYDPPMEKKQIAAFAPQVCLLAQKGDAAAQRVLERGAAGLAETARVLLQKLPQSTPLFTWGGIFEHCAAFGDLFAGELEREVRLLPNPPVAGALFAALAQDGITLTPEIRQNFQETWQVQAI